MNQNYLVFTRSGACGMDALAVIEVETLDSADTAALVVRFESAVGRWLSDPAAGALSLGRFCGGPTVADLAAANAFQRPAFQECLRLEGIQKARALYIGPVVTTYDYRREFARIERALEAT